MVDEERLKTIPKATSKRLPLYLRYLKMLEENGVTRIKSREFSEMTQIPSATIRRDFSHLGELGRSGYGYDVAYLIEVFCEILNTKNEKKIAIIGCGNLGKALINNNFGRSENLNIIAAFDTNPQLIGEIVNGVTIEDMASLAETVGTREITVAISTVPSVNAQKAIEAIIQSGITAILNFASDRVKVPSQVNMQYIDLTTELQTLIYYDETVQKKEKNLAFDKLKKAL
ncbi:redox-sensing transcriptional repressor Rex [Enterococcus timonensis]|uniref:redox-sensing transcriptional repressor Rex n=1 Tax=Enterococcus timonensis TaxID=1852364 RepID=UPI0008D8F299|nr:redox-sensing transcriptional repressor Rex [Enterococcus timonensis]